MRLLLAAMLTLSLSLLLVAACDQNEPLEGVGIEQGELPPDAAVDEGADVEGADAEAGDEPVDEAAAPAEDAHAAEVAWFEGTPDEAFSLAAEEGKPLFLYWGAEWCPPCHYLKTKIFHEPQFVAKSEEFVPVYLDGDDEGAQVLGEELGVLGYPTVIVFDPDGEEVMRMTSGIPVAEYAGVLDAAMANMVPVADVLASVQETGAAEADPADLSRLAYYSWDQDNAIELPEEEELETFMTLYQDTPEDLPVEKSRFLALAMNAAISRAAAAAAEAAEAASAEEGDEAAEGDEEVAPEPEPVLTDDEMADLDQAVQTMLADEAQRGANLYFILYWSREAAELLHPEPGEDRDAFVEAWTTAAQVIEEDEAMSADDRVSALYPQLELARLVMDTEAAAEAAEDEAAGDEAAEEAADEEAADEEAADEVADEEAADEETAEEEAADEEAADPEPEEPALPPELVDRVRQRVQWAGDTVTDEGELQAVMSSMVWMLEDAGLDEEASQLLEARMDDTIAPYYYMSWLAGNKADAEDPEGAIEWYRKAYDSATGRYTRFRWGSTYLRQLLELDPENEALFEEDATEILTELLTRDDAFALGNHSRLGRLEGSINGWNEEGAHDEVVTRLRDLVLAECERYPDGEEDSQQSRCLAFLAVEEEEEPSE